MSRALIAEQLCSIGLVARSQSSLPNSLYSVWQALVSSLIYVAQFHNKRLNFLKGYMLL